MANQWGGQSGTPDMLKTASQGQQPTSAPKRLALLRDKDPKRRWTGIMRVPGGQLARPRCSPGSKMVPQHGIGRRFQSKRQ
jgi:hypothetical protein